MAYTQEQLEAIKRLKGEEEGSDLPSIDLAHQQEQDIQDVELPEKAPSDTQESPEQPPVQDNSQSDIINKLKDSHIQLQSSPSLPPVPEQSQDEESPEVAPANPNQHILDMMKNSSHSVMQDLKDAQARRDQQVMVNQLGKAGELIGTGIGGTGNRGIVTKGMGAPIFDENIKQADKKVQDVKDQVAMESHDANSPSSAFFRKFLKDKYNVNVPDGMSASSLEKFLPPLMATEAKKAVLEQHRLDFQARIAESRAKTAEANSWKEKNFDAKQETQDTGRFDKMGKILTGEIASSRSPFGTATKTVQSVQRAEALANRFKDPNDLTTNEIGELSRVLDSVLSNGQPTVSGMNKLMPTAAVGDANKIASYITGLPRGAQMGAFVKRTLESLKTERELGIKQMKETQGKLLGSFSDLKDKNPDKWNTVLRKQGIDPTILDEDYQPGSESPSISAPALSSQQAGGVNSPAGKSIGNIKSSTLKDYASKHSISEQESAALLKKAGYSVEGY
jgi:hypothetical protein